MVKSRKYVEYCIMADIPLGRTEKAVLDRMTDKNGWFDEEAYLEVMENAPVYITAHQKELLRLIPQRYQQGGRYRARLRKLGKFLAQVYRFNTYSI